jgi:hypothetical protein
MKSIVTPLKQSCLIVPILIIGSGVEMVEMLLLDVQMNNYKLLKISLLLLFQHCTITLQDQASWSPGSCTVMHHTDQIHFQSNVLINNTITWSYQ